MKTPLRTTEEVKQKRTKSAAIYQKNMFIRLTGTNPAEIQTVASAIHSLSHPLVTGGKKNRLVTLTCQSFKPEKIFDGKL